MNVADAMTPRNEVVTTELPGTREDVLEYLQDRAFSSVPVIKRENGEEFRGLVSRERLIEEPDEDQLALLVEETPTTTGETAIEEVARVMAESGARRVPVVDGRLEGIITITDVVRAIADGDVETEATVGELGHREVNCIYVETPLRVAERELSLANVAYGVVLDEDGEACGMLTEADVIDVARVVEGEEDTGEAIANQDDEWMWEGIKAVGSRYMPTRNVEIPNAPVREFMTEDLLTISRRRSAQDAAQMMISNDVEQIPMTRADDLVGIVLDMDLLEAVG